MGAGQGQARRGRFPDGTPRAQRGRGDHCLFGAAFKPDIDDLRESPALAICQALAAQHPGRVLVVEPNVRELGGQGLALVDLETALAAADVRVILVRHKQFLTCFNQPHRFTVDTQGLLHA